MKNGLRGNLSKEFTKIIQTGENSDDETTGPVGCCKLKSYQVRSLCSRVAQECQERPLKILRYYFPALNYRPVQENNDPNIFTCRVHDVQQVSENYRKLKSQTEL